MNLGLGEHDGNYAGNRKSQQFTHLPYPRPGRSSQFTKAASSLRTGGAVLLLLAFFAE
jgi:hypothetical protein